jgi:hypothetical protein
MVIRNPTWSTDILWYETGYTKRKMLSPLKRLTWDRLHYWFCLKLLRICSPFFFRSSNHVPDFSVSEQYLQIFSILALVNIAQTKKNVILLTLMSAKFWIFNEEETFFLCLFSFVYPFYYLLFLDKNKKSITQQNTRSSQINQRRSPNIFRIFWYRNKAFLVKYQNRKR